MTLCAERELASYVSGGYLLVHNEQRQEYMNSKLLPERIISASACVCEVIPDTWVGRWGFETSEDQAERAALFNLGLADLAPMAAWVERGTALGDMQFPSVFHSVSTAREFFSKFLRNGEDVALIGIGLHQQEARSFLEATELKREAPVGQPFRDELLRGAPLDLEGVVLGFELLMSDLGAFHSWLCHGLETVVAEATRVLPNAAGLLALETDAKSAASCCNHAWEDQPGLWQPWVLVQYPNYST